MACRESVRNTQLRQASAPSLVEVHLEGMESEGFYGSEFPEDCKVIDMSNRVFGKPEPRADVPSEPSANNTRGAWFHHATHNIR